MVKEKKKILLVSNGFYPEISPRSFRATELTKELVRQGHEVTVFSKHRDSDYSSLLTDFPFTFVMWKKSIFRLFPELNNKYLSFITRLKNRFLLLCFEYPGIEEMFILRKMLRRINGYDLMISFAVPYPVHWGVAWARSDKNPIAKTWVADCGDPYMFSRLDTFRKPFYFKFLEVNFCRKCDYISVPFPEMKLQFYSEFISKIIVIPQGFDFTEIRLFEGELNSNRPVFVFAGTIIPGKRDLSSLLDFLSSLNRDFYFKIYTSKPEWFSKYKLMLGDKLIVNEYIDRLSLLFEMSKADFLVNVDTVLDNLANIEAVPSKLIDYALTNRPILNINSANPDKEMVLEFLDGDYSRQRVIDKSIYDIRSVTAKFMNLNS